MQAGYGAYDYGAYTATPAAAAHQGGHIGYAHAGYVNAQSSYASDNARGTHGGAAAVAAQAAATFGGYPYPAAQAQVVDGMWRPWTQAGFVGPDSARPMSLQVMQPPPGMAPTAQEFYPGGEAYPYYVIAPVQSASGAVVTASGAATAHMNSSFGGLPHQAASNDLSRVLHGQPPPPPPPAQAPRVETVPVIQASTAMVDRPVDDENEQAMKAKYGMLGMLDVVRMTNPDLNMLASGMRLTGLGLDLHSPGDLSSTFGSPWLDGPVQPLFCVPPCYKKIPLQFKQRHLQTMRLDTLFHMFFNLPRDILQAYAAAELYNRNWKYHKDLNMWFRMHQEVGGSRWECFDPTVWRRSLYNQSVDENGFLSEDDVRVRPAQAHEPAN